MTDLLAFLRARYDDDERVARAADSGRWLPEDKGITFEYHADDFHQGEAQARLVADTRANQEHIARHDPDRVLREVEAKRRILDGIITRRLDPTEPDGGWEAADAETDGMASSVVRLLALSYADHEGYRPEWRPEGAIAA